MAFDGIGRVEPREWETQWNLSSIWCPSHNNVRQKRRDEMRV